MFLFFNSDNFQLGLLASETFDKLTEFRIARKRTLPHF